MSNRTVSAGLIAVLAFLLGSSPRAVAIGEILDRPGIIGSDQSCLVEPGWSHYYYRVPVLVQEVSHVGTLRAVAFGYADACKQAKKGVRGGTHANLMELPGMWADGVIERMNALELAPAPIALPELSNPGSNLLSWDLPRVKDSFQTLYDPEEAPIWCVTDSVGLLCPGIPPEAGTILRDASFEPKTDPLGVTRWLIDASPNAQGWFAWFPSRQSTATSETFYARHFAEDMKANHSDGGLLRIVLHPVNLALHQAPETTLIQGDSAAIIPLLISNQSTRSQLRTAIGWRLKGEVAWRPVTAWRATTNPNWQTTPIPLTAQGDTAIEVQITPVAPSQVIELMVNHAEAIPELRMVNSNIINTNAYADNITSTKIAGGVDLAVVSVTAPRSVGKPGDRYIVSWEIANHSDQTVAGAVRRVALRMAATGQEYPIGAKAITLGPRERRTEQLEIAVTSCSDAYTATVSLTAPAGIQETSGANNARSAASITDACAGTASQAGEGEVIIVPADCIPNPDITSPKPCTNYDLIIPGGP